MAIRYIADWHYGHRNIILYDRRPFADTDEMNRVLVENWNRVVQPDDLVYVLGDMFWCVPGKACQVLDQLAGKKVLIRGNHDDTEHTRFRNCFDGIYDYLEIEDEGRPVVLCHYPIPFYKNQPGGWYHLYGHVHVTPDADMILDLKRRWEEQYHRPFRMYNVGAMMPCMDYTPRTLDEILAAFPETESAQS